MKGWRWGLAIGLSFSTISCAVSMGKAFLIEGFDAMYKPQIQKVAILPFDNRTAVSNVETGIRDSVYKRMMKISGDKGGPVILPQEEVDDVLMANGFFNYSQVMNVPMQELGKKLGVDSVLVGITRVYVEPTGGQRFSSLIINLGQARSTVETLFQLYSCKDGQLLWEKVSTGNFEPIFGASALISSPEQATNLMCDDLVASWPFKQQKSQIRSREKK
jgi:hypothetical protein